MFVSMEVRANVQVGSVVVELGAVVIVVLVCGRPCRILHNHRIVPGGPTKFIELD